MLLRVTAWRETTLVNWATVTGPEPTTTFTSAGFDSAPRASVATTEKLSVTAPAGFGAVKVGAAAEALESITGGPAVCFHCQPVIASPSGSRAEPRSVTPA